MTSALEDRGSRKRLRSSRTGLVNVKYKKGKSGADKRKTGAIRAASQTPSSAATLPVPALMTLPITPLSAAPPRRAAAATAQAISEAQQVYESTELPPEYKRNKAGQIEMLGDSPVKPRKYRVGRRAVKATLDSEGPIPIDTGQSEGKDDEEERQETDDTFVDSDAVAETGQEVRKASGQEEGERGSEKGTGSCEEGRVEFLREDSLQEDTLREDILGEDILREEVGVKEECWREDSVDLLLGSPVREEAETSPRGGGREAEGRIAREGRDQREGREDREEQEYVSPVPSQLVALLDTVKVLLCTDSAQGSHPVRKWGGRCFVIHLTFFETHLHQ